MSTTCHSEFYKLKSVFVKNAADAFVSDSKLSEEWEELNFLGKPDLNRAISESQKFVDILKREGIEVNFFPKDSSVTIDSLYCRDASIATDGGVILCNMGKQARVNEPMAQWKIFAKQNITILGSIHAPGTLEGGDVVWLNERTLVVGQSYRTNSEGIRQLKGLLVSLGVDLIVAQLPHYKGPSGVFHLMSIISPVDRDLAVVYSPLMPIPLRSDLLNRGFKLVEVPEEEFSTMGCNILTIAPRRCIMMSGNPKTKQALEQSGCVVTEYEGSEISLKGGGGPTCLTRPLDREY